MGEPYIELSPEDGHVLMVMRNASIAEDEDGELAPCCRMTPEAAGELMAGIATCLHRMGRI